MQLAEAVAMGRALLDEHGLSDWELVLDRAKRRAGICRYAQRQIGLSGPLTALHDEAEVRDTILHEIAHALVGPRHGHDAAWRATARRIGCSGERCVDPGAPTIEGDWVGTCAAGHRVTRHRRPDRPLSCRRCGSRFDLAHLLTWTHRGREVPMSAAYAAQLERVLRLPAPAPAVGTSAPLRPGEQARVVAPGRYHGVVGTLVKRGRSRYHLQVRGGVLTVPFHLAEKVP